MANEPPAQLMSFTEEYPEVWSAFRVLGETCHNSGGPLDEKARRLAKLGIAIGTRHEGAVHSAVRHALASGVSIAEMKHVAILSVTTIGWPAAHAAITWIEDVVHGPGDRPESRMLSEP